jgi:hypothetical protein
MTPILPARAQKRGDTHIGALQEKLIEAVVELRAGLQNSPNQACSRRPSAITSAGVTVR